MRCIAFKLGDGQYALPLRDIVEVLPLLTIHELPHAPDYIRGIINYRGQSLPVLDLCQLTLGRPSKPRMSTRLFVLRLQAATPATRLLALLVEQAVSELNIDPEKFVAPPVQINETPYLTGISVSADGLLQLVEISYLLPDKVLATLYPEQELF